LDERSRITVTTPCLAAQDSDSERDIFALAMLVAHLRYRARLNGEGRRALCTYKYYDISEQELLTRDIKASLVLVLVSYTRKTGV
jgi:hypothetical protein